MGLNVPWVCKTILEIRLFSGVMSLLGKKFSRKELISKQLLVKKG